MLALSADPLEALVIDFVNAGIPKVAANIDRGIKNRAPVDTARLKAAIDVDNQTDANTVKFIVEVTDSEAARYGLFNDTGTKAHTITARNASVLTNGTDFFGKTVNHPGSTKNKGWWSDAPWDQWLCEAYQ